MSGTVAVGAAPDDLPLDGAAHLGHFLGPFVDQQHDDLHFRMVLRHRLREMLKQDGLAGPRRRDDQAALPLADRRQQVHHARRQRFRAIFQLDALVRIDRRQLIEIAARILLGRHPLDRLHILQARAAAALLPRLRRPGDHHAFAQLVLLDQPLIDKRIARLRDVVLGHVAHEAVALRMKFEDALLRICSGGHVDSGVSGEW